MTQLFETTATATGGRNGHVKSEDGLIDMELRVPTKMGGDGGRYTNPEQLFAATYSSCFDGALNLVAQMEKVKIESTTSATVGLAKSDDNKYGITAKIEVAINGVDEAKANELLQKAHEICPYSRAIRGNVDVQVSLKQQVAN